MKTSHDATHPERGDGGLKLVNVIASLMAVLVVLILVKILPALYEPRRRRLPGNSAAAIAALRTIETAQSIFRESDRDGDEVFDFGSLTDLGRANLVDTVLSAGVKQGYTFTVKTGGFEDPMGEYIWWAAADPVVPGSTGDRYFFINQGGRIWFSNTAPIRALPGTSEPASGSLLGGP